MSPDMDDTNIPPKKEQLMPVFTFLEWVTHVRLVLKWSPPPTSAYKVLLLICAILHLLAAIKSKMKIGRNCSFQFNLLFKIQDTSIGRKTLQVCLLYLCHLRLLFVRRSIESCYKTILKTTKDILRMFQNLRLAYVHCAWGVYFVFLPSDSSMLLSALVLFCSPTCKVHSNSFTLCIIYLSAKMIEFLIFPRDYLQKSASCFILFVYFKGKGFTKQQS